MPERIQSIDAVAARVVNHHPFGRDLAGAAQQALPVLTAAGLDHGFMDGGCYAFARGLKGLLEAQPEAVPAAVFVIGRPGIADHVVTRVDLGGQPLFADADGLATSADLFEKMQELERLRATPLSIRPLDPGETGDDVLDYHEIGLPARITRALDRALGPIDPRRLSLAWADDPAPAEPSPSP